MSWFVSAAAVFAATLLLSPPKPGDVCAANIGASTVTCHDLETGAHEVFVEAGAGGLKGPTGLTFGPDDHLYVSSSQTNQVLRYDGSTGAFLGVFAEDSALTMPFSLIFGPDERLYVSSGSGNAVLRFDGTTGELLNVAAAGDGLKQPIGLAFGPDGMLYVANSGGANVMRFDPETGESRGVFAADSLKFPSDVTFGPDGNLYVSSASTYSVVRFDGRTGAFMDVFGRLPDKGVPVGIAFSADGYLLAGDFAKSRLFRFGPDGGEGILVSAEGLVRPENIAVKP